MAWHTIQEAEKLTGKSRRTLYRDMAKGRLSWVPEGENARRLETSELIRAYGSLLPVAQPEAEKTAHGDSDNDTQGTSPHSGRIEGIERGSSRATTGDVPDRAQA